MAREACLGTGSETASCVGLLWFGSAGQPAGGGRNTSRLKEKSSGYSRPGRSAYCGPFLYKNQCAAFIELVFPLAVYQSLVDRRDSLLYVGMAAAMFAAVVTAVSRAGAVLVTGELVVVLLLSWRRGLIPAANLRRRASVDRGARRGAGGGGGLAGHA